MSLESIKKEVKQLRDLIIVSNEPLHKIFIFRDNGLTVEGESKEDAEAYRATHSQTRVIKLCRRSCRIDK